MKDRYWEEVNTLYTALYQQMMQMHQEEEKELGEARDRAVQQLTERCLAEHGSHQDDGVACYCQRCGVDMGGA